MKILRETSSKENLDDPLITTQRSKILKQKFFLKKIYIDFYKDLSTSLSSENRKGKIVELGSGGGFIKKIIPNTTTSDILKLVKVDMQFSALKMPFKSTSVNAFVMIDVFHHINDIELFLKEAERCLKIGGQIIMIEPANTFFGGFIYKYFHHEAFIPKGRWIFSSSGPLSGANAALPWIVFFRDRKKFEKKYPNLKIIKTKTHTPIKYILSGGFSYRQLLPNTFYSSVNFIEKILSPFNAQIGLFYTITIVKIK